MKRFKRSPKNQAACLFLSIVEEWVAPGSDNLPDDITTWLDMQDRSGLLKINTGFYSFMKESEPELRKHWNVQLLPKYMNQNALPVLMSEVKSSLVVQQARRDLIGDSIENDILSEVLLEDTLQIWTLMRIRQVVQLYIFNCKQKSDTPLSRKGTPALRKTLDKFY